MALTRADKEMIESLKLSMSLRWSDPVEPDVDIPTGRELSKGYLPVAACSDSARVCEACSSSVHHGTSGFDKATIQQPVRLYSTKLLALRALRYQVACYCAKLLRRIDAQIEAEQGKAAE